MIGRLLLEQNKIKPIVSIITYDNIISLLGLLHNYIGFKVKPMLSTRRMGLARIIPSNASFTLYSGAPYRERSWRGESLFPE